MEPEVKQDDVLISGTTTDEIVGELPPATEDSTGQQYQQIIDKATALLGDLPDYLTTFFGQYRRPIVTIGLVIGAIIAVRLTLAILKSINDIPLLSPSFELIGIGYSAWFVYRYLLKASTRSELVSDFNGLKEQILGDRLSN
ncbi:MULTISPECIES: CAAD domain-containing protein [unclassified Leptolyngbya]|uniref:CAAD domain-containing protein n=1 Tax=unclassified Leptolyngbya TaxID=2650499 RepID=UPI00168519D8|nr:MULTISPECIES: CAAD domain-containing protein [unclassified Leptolyngbya]MBD1910291.1 CAAD domain-containing protein [Leptolyngbya sp. FACHB-8]MBD2155797.1 CAAD domain-containing protein [Leptolyngbya sp. FACHB-16]